MLNRLLRLLVFTAMALFLHYCHSARQGNPADGSSAVNVGADASLCAPGPIDLNTEPGFDGRLTPLFEGLDVYQYPVTTKSRLAQRYFDQGFILNYGFNHAEAARSFREAIRQDPECAMAYWGLAYVLGPNYNVGMDPSVLAHANDALIKANMYKHKAAPHERALIEALSKRYPRALEEDPKPYYQAYADAMREVMNRFPEDVDIAVMTAEALMDLHPWDLYEKDGTPKPWTPEILEILRKAAKMDPNHPQMMHLAMHAWEAGGNPEEVLPLADRLRLRVPGAGHLVHMPSHLYINTGHYHEATMANERAVKIDSAYVEACHEAGVYPMVLYPHNWHFLTAAAALEGKGKRSLEAARYLADFAIDHDAMYEKNWLALQHFYSIPWYIMVKFAMWGDILQEKQPDERLLYPNAIWHYARGMALANQGRYDEASRELARIGEISQDSVIQKMTIWDMNTATDLLQIASHVLSGEIAYRKGNYAEAVRQFQAGVAIEDKLNYTEPPDWFFSVRHPLGAALMADGRYAEAEAIYRTDLLEWKNNGWALMGLYQALLKQNRAAEAKAVKQRFDEAWQYADTQLVNSVL